MNFCDIEEIWTVSDFNINGILLNLIKFNTSIQSLHWSTNGSRKKLVRKKWNFRTYKHNQFRFIETQKNSNSFFQEMQSISKGKLYEGYFLSKGSFSLTATLVKILSKTCFTPYILSYFSSFFFFVKRLS